MQLWIVGLSKVTPIDESLKFEHLPFDMAPGNSQPYFHNRKLCREKYYNPLGNKRVTVNCRVLVKIDRSNTGWKVQKVWLFSD